MTTPATHCIVAGGVPGSPAKLSKLEDKLSHLIQKDADEAILTRQIDRVETARANTNKTRSVRRGGAWLRMAAA